MSEIFQHKKNHFSEQNIIYGTKNSFLDKLILKNKSKGFES